MKIIAIQKESKGLTARDFVPHLRDEAEVGWQFYKEGFIREMFYKGDKPETILILESENIESARNKLQQLPLVKKGLIEFDLIQLKAYHGFERLFSKK